MNLYIIKYDDQEVVEMKVNYPNSIFLDEIYNDSLMGVDPVSGSVIYCFNILWNIQIGLANANQFKSRDEYEQYQTDCAADIYTLFRDLRSSEDVLQYKKVPPVLFQEFGEVFFNPEKILIQQAH